MDSKLNVLLKHIPAQMHEAYALHLSTRKKNGHLPQLSKLYMELAKNNFEGIDGKRLVRKLKTTNLPTVMSKLYKDVETFCIQKMYEGAPEATFPELLRLKFYGEIRMWSVYKSLRQRFMEHTFSDEVYFPEDTYLLYRFFKLDAINIKYYGGRKDNGELLLPIKYLNLFYQFEQAKMQVELSFRNEIVNAHYSNIQLPIGNEPNSLPTIILLNIQKIILSGYVSLITDYPILLQLFKQLSFNVNRHAESIKTLVHFLMNLCIKGTNRGYLQFCSEYLYLVEFLAEKKLLVEKGKVEISIYKNAISMAMKLDKLLWVNDFSTKYAELLDVKYGNEMKDYYLALRAFANGEVSNAELLIPNKIADWYDEPFLQLSLMRLRVKILIEKYNLDRWDELEAQLRQMRNFLKKAQVGKSLKSSYLGFILRIEALMNHSYKDCDEVRNEEAILDREWLLKKSAQLRKHGSL